MYETIQELLKTNYNTEQVALLFTNFKDAIANDDTKEINEILESIKNNININIYNEFYNEYKDNLYNIKFFIEELDDNLDSILADKLKVCPRCGKELSEVKNRFTGKIDYICCIDCGWKLMS